MKKNQFQKTQISTLVNAIFTKNTKKKLTAGAIAFSLMAGAGLVHALPVDITDLAIDGRSSTGAGPSAGSSAYFKVERLDNANATPSSSYVITVNPYETLDGDLLNSRENARLKSIDIRDEGIFYAPTTAGNGETLNLDVSINTYNNYGIHVTNDYSVYTSTTREDTYTGLYDEDSVMNINSDISASEHGIFVENFQGNLIINNNSTILGSRNGEDTIGSGIYAQGQLTYGSNNGGEDNETYYGWGWGNTFSLNNEGTINGDQYGVHVDSFSKVSINNTGLIGGDLFESNVPDVALDISNIGNYVSTGEDISVDVTNGSVGMGADSGQIIGQTGIYIRDINWGTYAVSNQAQGNVSITNINGEIRGLNGDAIRVENVGGGLTIVNGVAGEDSLISGFRFGINASNIAREVNIGNGVDGTITSSYYSAINLDNVGAVTIYNDGIISSSGLGEDQANLNDYNNETIEVSNVNFGGVSITNSGSILAMSTTTYQDAIDIEDVVGNVVIINALSGVISSNGDVLQISDVDGNLSVTNYGLMSNLGTPNGDDGLDIDQIYGNVNILNRGYILAQDEAIHLESIYGTVNITNSGTITSTDDVVHIGSLDGNLYITNELNGVMTSTGYRVIHIEQDYNGFGDGSINTVTIVNHGVMSAYKEVVRVDGLGGEDDIRVNSVSFTNTGTMTGGMQFNDINGAVTIVNSGVWNMGFAGEDGLGNNLSDVFSSSFEASNTGAVTITNSGVINLRGNTYFDTYSSSALTFNNSGTIDMTADHANSDGRYSYLEFNAFGEDSIVFNGTVNGVSGSIKVDALLGSAGGVGANVSNNDTVFIDGIANGQTSIRVTDANPTVPGVNNPVGKEVVVVTDQNTLDGAFVLAGGPINKGLWQYDLYTTVDDGDKVWRLASVPSSQAFELPQVISAAQNVWFLGADAVQERSQELRLAEGERANGGIWAKVLGGRDRSFVDNSYTLDGKTSAYKTDSTQTIGGLLIGADSAINLESGGQWLLGAMFGGSNAKQKFSATNSKSDNDSATVGLYANYVGKNGGFVNFLMKADFGSADYSVNNGTGISATQKISTNSVGGQIQTGYRFASPYAFIEPVLSIGTVSVASDSFSMLATDVTTKGTSTRGSLGFNTGFTVPVGGLTLSPVFSAKYVTDFNGDNTTGLVSGDQPVVNVTDTRTKNFGQYGLTLKVAGSKSGSYGYVKVQQDSGSSTESSSATAGLKVVW